MNFLWTEAVLSTVSSPPIIAPGSLIRHFDKHQMTDFQGRDRDTDIENGFVDTAGKGRVGRAQRSGLTYILCHV